MTAAAKIILKTVMSESLSIKKPEKKTDKASALPKMIALTNLFPSSFVRYRLKM